MITNNKTLTKMAHETAIGFASAYGLAEEVEQMIASGYTPEEALEYYDII